ncbi:MAG TPA: ornithine cyclodeaminase [Actinophytocola sp.]|uniref:ornithine cyclodeaminase n=1 Tax=Actinophytocola sp. TaxID=1872138 RepID=UPI002DBAFE55|nr:ornithine cyclodeaminase [Actinophytocola sp.]HEU5471247.1 ornithine cyclodeaminase [Actinophytocola sp.]
MTTGTITYLDSADVDRLCAGLPVVDLVHETLLAFHRKEAGLFPETGLHWTTPSGASARSLILPAWSGDRYGCKIINASLGNQRLGLPRAAGLIVLNDPETARPVCVMAGGRISALRTAAVSVAAVRAVRDLADITSVAFLGCGRQAEVHLELLTPACPNLTEVLLYDVDRTRAVRLAERGPNRAVVDRPHDAVAAARLSVAVTTTTESYVELDWVPAGGTFVNVSLDDAAESLLLGCDHLFVDDWDLVTGDDHRLLGVLARAGRVSGPAEPAPEGGRAVDADLPTLLSGGYPRRIAAGDRVVINPFGMGVHDIALAAAVYGGAIRQGIGRSLPR